METVTTMWIVLVAISMYEVLRWLLIKAIRSIHSMLYEDITFEELSSTYKNEGDER